MATTYTKDKSRTYRFNFAEFAIRAFFLALTAVVPFAAEASDKAVLDALVEKGILTPEEARNISKESAGQVVKMRPQTKSLKLSSRFQLQYEWIDDQVYSGAGSPAYDSSQGFIVRRFFIQADADLGGGWDARFSVDLARSYVNSVFTDTYVSKKIDGEYLSGRLYLGYMKPGFAIEDVFSSFSLNAIERSAATMYWTGAANNRRLGVGNRYMGVRWNGDIKQVKGLSYILSVTNAYQLSPTEIEELSYNYGDNHLAYWASVHYSTGGEDWNLKVGTYSMYSSGANYNMGRTNSASIYSINPYYSGNWRNLYFWGDYMASGVADGRKVGTGYAQTNPYGVNFSIEYRFDIGEYGKIAPTFRYSWVDTGGRGLRISDAQRQATNSGTTYNNAQDFYIGVNWYLRGDDLKIQLGYTYVQYSGVPSDKHSDSFADSSSVRLQFQMKL